MKRAIDLALAAASLVLAAPIMALLAAAVYASMGPPVLFRQHRIGFRERSFVLLKFRTMRGTSVPGREALDDEQRLTRLGRFLRRTSLDELPQIWNVLRGDMSLVGPRPLLPEYLPVYTAEQRQRHDVRPGVTGWAQVNGRNATTWAERLAMDVWYVQHRGFWLDLRILVRTAAQVLHVGARTADLHRPMPRLDGRTDV